MTQIPERIPTMKNRILSTRLTDEQLGLFYLGQVGFIIKYKEKYLCIDPFLTGGVRGVDERGFREFKAPILPEELDFLDYVFCTHDHLDHTDPRTVSGIAAVNKTVKFVIPAPFVDNVVKYGVPREQIIPARDGDVITDGDIVIRPLPSAHEELHQDENGDYCEMGYQINFGDISIYHCGDSTVYDGQAEKVGKVDIAMLPVNGRSYYKLKHNLIGNMTLEEAVLFAKDAEAKLFIPLHIDMFAMNTIPKSYIPAGVDQYNKGMPYHIFTPGERFIFMK